MTVHFDDSGFRKLRKKIHDMPDSWNAKFSPEFMREWTDYNSMDALIAASGFSAEEIRAFQDTPNEAWEQFIQEHTRFDSWHDFMEQFMMDHLRRQLPEFR
jgi:hypothetical protein